VQLYNSADAAVDLSGYQLFDGSKNDSYTFADGTVIPAGGYLTVYCTQQLIGPAYAPLVLLAPAAKSFIL